MVEGVINLPQLPQNLLDCGLSAPNLGRAPDVVFDVLLIHASNIFLRLNPVRDDTFFDAVFFLYINFIKI